MIKNISILGSTGSIGISTLDLVRRYPEKYKVLGLAAGSNLDILMDQIKEFNPKIVSVKDQNLAEELSKKLNSESSPEILYGEKGATKVATLEDISIVISAIVGAAGLIPTLSAIEKGKTIGLANKESMVIAGEIMSAAAKKYQSTILPVDSEHSAIFQCLQYEKKEGINHIILTASGGPFRETPLADFHKITVKEALNHPNWDMGPKITIDSATMMNKGLEVMEAKYLFDCDMDQIQVCVHPQSIIHSMVEYKDGSTLAHLGLPDMKVPIGYALSYPERYETGVKPLNLAEIKNLSFFEPDLEKFPCLGLAMKVGNLGKTYPAVLNAANEITVDAFLKEKISFLDIAKLNEETLNQHEEYHVDKIEDIINADRWARQKAQELVEKSIKIYQSA